MLLKPIARVDELCSNADVAGCIRPQAPRIISAVFIPAIER